MNLSQAGSNLKRTVVNDTKGVKVEAAKTLGAAGGSKGGTSKSAAKQAASKRNGSKGGRPVNPHSSRQQKLAHLAESKRKLAESISMPVESQDVALTGCSTLPDDKPFGIDDLD